MALKVTITKKHTSGYLYQYCDNHDCPLFRAIKDQYPDYPLESVGGNYIRLVDGTQVDFAPHMDSSENMTRKNAWCLSTAQTLAKGEIESFTVTLLN